MAWNKALDKKWKKAVCVWLRTAQKTLSISGIKNQTRTVKE
jgi:hypothetical protein